MLEVVWAWCRGHAFFCLQKEKENKMPLFQKYPSMPLTRIKRTSRLKRMMLLQTPTGSLEKRVTDQGSASRAPGDSTQASIILLSLCGARINQNILPWRLFREGFAQASREVRKLCSLDV